MSQGLVHYGSRTYQVFDTCLLSEKVSEYYIQHVLVRKEEKQSSSIRSLLEMQSAWNRQTQKSYRKLGSTEKDTAEEKNSILIPALFPKWQLTPRTEGKNFLIRSRFQNPKFYQQSKDAYMSLEVWQSSQEKKRRRRIFKTESKNIETKMG